MANNYRVKVEVEIVACADGVDDTPVKSGIGTFEWVISAEQAYSIDDCEQRLLQTNYAALRDAFAHHLSAVSQQYALEMAGSLAECEVKPYRVDSEIGRIRFDTYWVEQIGRATGNEAGCPFPTLRAQEWYRTSGPSPPWWTKLCARCVVSAPTCAPTGPSSGRRSSQHGWLLRPAPAVAPAPPSAASRPSPCGTSPTSRSTP